MKGYKEVTVKTLELAEELGRIPMAVINDAYLFIKEMKQEGWNCFVDVSTDYMICEMDF